MRETFRIIKRHVTKGVNLLPFSSRILGTPRKSQETAAYLKEHPEVPVYVLKNEQVIDLPLPILNTEDIPAAFVSRRMTKQQFILQLSNARIWGANGAVITQEDILLHDLSREFGIKNPSSDHSVFHNVLLKRPVSIRGTIAVIATAGSSVYYHWMLDILPRLLLLKEANLTESIEHFIINYQGLSFQKQTLEALGIAESKILCCNDNWNFHIEAQQVFVPSLLSNLNEVNAYECGLLKKYLQPESASFISKRIYITRRRAGTRTLLNESVMIDYLNAYGFVVLEMEVLSIVQQAQVFQGAEIIIGPHGSAFTNLVFCRPGTVLIDLLPDTNVVSCFYTIAAQLGIAYYGFIGKGIPMNESNKSDHIQVNMDAFTNYFESHIVPMF